MGLSGITGLRIRPLAVLLSLGSGWCLCVCLCVRACVRACVRVTLRSNLSIETIGSKTYASRVFKCRYLCVCLLVLRGGVSERKNSYNNMLLCVSVRVWGLSLSEWTVSVLIPAPSALIWKEGSDWAYPRHTCHCDSCDSCQAQGPQTNSDHTTAYLWNSHLLFTGNHCRSTVNESGTNVAIPD